MIPFLALLLAASPGVSSDIIKYKTGVTTLDSSPCNSSRYRKRSHHLGTAAQAWSIAQNTQGFTNAALKLNSACAEANQTTLMEDQEF